jgi:hypothetical protein
MHWFRTNIGLGSRLALFALAVQVMLSFGHVHGFGLASANTAPSVIADGSAVPGPGAPAHKPDGSGDPGCAICALIQLAATSTPSSAPALLLPVRLDRVRPDIPTELAVATALHFPFRARAPPVI